MNHKSSGDTLSCYSCSLAPAGNRTKVVEHSGRIVEYTYDETYRLTEEKINDPVFGLRTIQYTYDPVGNRLFKVDNGDTTAYAYDTNNRLLTEDDTEYLCDDNGNTIQKIVGVDTTDYQYDYQDRLVEAAYDTVQVNYVYDFDGIRVQKTVADVDTIHYLIDDNRDFAQVLQERDNSGIVSASYTHGHDLICQKRDSSLTYFHYDGQMSVRNLTDEWQNITDGYTFDAFGILLTQFGATQNNYLYTGEQFDPNVGFYYLRARYYNPEIGRFATVDPWKGSIYDPVSLHRYLYCGNDPINYTDFSGTDFAMVGGSSYSIVELTTVIIITGIMLAATMSRVKFPPGFSRPKPDYDLEKKKYTENQPSKSPDGFPEPDPRQPKGWQKFIEWLSKAARIKKERLEAIIEAIGEFFG